MTLKNGQIIDLAKIDKHTREQAEGLIGKQAVQGKIIGVSTKPHAGKKDGVYVVTTQPGELSKHHKVG